jgi:hypothetical protein
VKEALDSVEVAPRVRQRRQHQQRCERGHPGADRVDRQRDPDRDAVAWAPAAEPVGERLLSRVDREQHAQDEDGERAQRGDAVFEPSRRERARRDEQRRGEEWDHHRERG